MGNIGPDPVDHARTTRLHAGETLKNSRSTPGLVLGLLALAAFIICLYLFGSGHAAGGAIAALLAVLAGAAAVVWVLAEHRRVNQAEAVWVAEHPGAHVEPPTG